MATLTSLKTHYIVLIQVSEDPKSRTFCEYSSLNECMQGVSSYFDDFIKETYPDKGEEVQYDVAGLVKFLRSFKDLSCLVYQKHTNVYLPQGKDWILQEVYKYQVKQYTQ